MAYAIEADLSLRCLFLNTYQIEFKAPILLENVEQIFVFRELPQPAENPLNETLAGDWWQVCIEDNKNVNIVFLIVHVLLAIVA